MPWYEEADEWTAGGGYVWEAVAMDDRGKCRECLEGRWAVSAMSNDGEGG